MIDSYRLLVLLLLRDEFATSSVMKCAELITFSLLILLASKQTTIWARCLTAQRGKVPLCATVCHGVHARSLILHLF